MRPMQIINTLADAKGANAKIEVIAGLGINETTVMKGIVAHALNDMVSFYITSIDEFKPTLFDENSDADVGLYDFTYELMQLNDKGSANGADRLKLAKMRHQLDDETKQLVDLIVARDLRCGCGLNTFRKVWGKDFLPAMEYALMGAYDEQAILDTIDFTNGAISQLKSDGARCIVTGRNGKITARSRNGKPILGMATILESAEKLGVDDRDFDLDGELVVLSKKGKILPRKIGNGIISKAVKGTLPAEEAARIRYVVWDLIIRTEEGLKETYANRFNRLIDMLKWSGAPAILAQETKIVKSLREAKEHYREMVLRGEEGTVLKNMNSLWTPGDSKSARAANGFKFKEEFDAEFIIKSWYFGDPKKKFAKCVGGFAIESACGQVVSNVGGGLSDKERMVDNPDDYVGGIVTVRYNARIMADGSTTWSLFLPRVIEFRHDKNVADDLEKIIEQEEAAREAGM